MAERWAFSGFRRPGARDRCPANVDAAHLRCSTAAQCRSECSASCPLHARCKASRTARLANKKGGGHEKRHQPVQPLPSAGPEPRFQCRTDIGMQPSSVFQANTEQPHRCRRAAMLPGVESMQRGVADYCRPERLHPLNAEKNNQTPSGLANA